MLVRIVDLSVNFINGKHSVSALDNINIALDRGYVYALFGPSGSGKTTLLNVLSGLVKPTNGTVFFEENQLSAASHELSRYRKERVGLVFQNLMLVDHLNCIENIMLGAESVKSDQLAETEDLMKFLGIFDVRNLDISQLSGGERQRVAIARCLINNPDLVLMDEPTANLDYENATKIMELSRDIAVKGNKCVVVVTHDARLLNYVNYVVKLSDGRVVQ
jgi:putative ABC transport system ATP-binding protein